MYTVECCLEVNKDSNGKLELNGFFHQDLEAEDLIYASVFTPESSLIFSLVSLQ
jgi:hypothetical protein